MSAVLPEIAGNETLLEELTAMRRGNHLPHALLLHGEHGTGKKLIAKWFTMLVMCEDAENAPCCKCRSCRLILDDAHPDVYYAEHSGKKMGFSVETARDVRREAAILPNNGDKRIFLFCDADGMSPQAQNALLKSVEEPPPHALFVFTAETVGVLLPTLLSRMTVKSVSPVTRPVCIEALVRRDFSPEDAQQAASRFGGNIGKCLAYLSDEKMRRCTDTAAALTAALAGQDEYTLLRLLTAAAADKDELRQVLSLLDVQIRDAAMLTLEGDFTRLGCDRKSAEALSGRLTPRRTARLHGAISEAVSDLDGNVGAVLTVTALCAALYEA